MHRQDPAAYRTFHEAHANPNLHPPPDRAFVFGAGTKRDQADWAQYAEGSPAWPPPTPGSVNDLSYMAARSKPSHAVALVRWSSKGRYHQLLWVVSKHLLSNTHSLAAGSSLPDLRRPACDHLAPCSAVGPSPVRHCCPPVACSQYVPQAESMQRYGGLLHSWLRPHFLDPAFLNHAALRCAPIILTQQAAPQTLRP